MFRRENQAQCEELPQLASLCHRFQPRIRACCTISVVTLQELPEALYDYVYDFGFLGEVEEESYVRAMVEPVFPAIAGRRSPWVECVKDSGRGLRVVLMPPNGCY